jgi:hypothetical protein
LFDGIAVCSIGPRITAVLQTVCVTERGAAPPTELNRRFGENTAHPPPPGCGCNSELNLHFAFDPPGGREGRRPNFAFALADLVKLRDGEADFSAHFNQPDGIAQDARQHLPVGFHIAQIAESLFAKGGDGAAVFDNDRLQGADQALHGSCSSSTRAR